MSILDRLLSHIVPHSCLGCNREGSLLCLDCRGRLQIIPERCYRCRKLSAGGKTCSSCRSSSRLYQVRAVAIYEGLAKDIIWKLKFAGVQAAADEISQLLAPLLTSRF